MPNSAQTLIIVSGGQTGVDRAALDAALQHGVACGGWCPAQRLAEDGPINSRYPLQEMAQSGYVERTKRNVEDSDATLVIYESELEGGTAYTVALCRQLDKPVLLIDSRHLSIHQAVDRIRAFTDTYRVSRLNVAGPRASKNPNIYAIAFAILSAFLTDRTLA